MNILKRLFVNYRNLTPKNPPIIICGCHGGGTSFVVKLLRMRGFFAGDDVEPIEARKVHESKVFKNKNEYILGQLLPGRCGDSNKPSFAMRTNNSKDWDLFFRRINDEKLVKKIISSINIKDIFKIYWGDEKSENYPIWGWKDPRNSLLLRIWKSFFPGARILMITRPIEVPKKKSHSVSGGWFSNEATPEVKKIYMNPPELFQGEYDVFYFDFDADVGDFEKFNKLLNWMGLEVLSDIHEFEALLRAANFEVNSVSVSGVHKN